MTAAISGQSHKVQHGRAVTQSSQTSATKAGQEALMDEFSAVLDKIAVQLADMDIPYSELKVDIKAKAQQKDSKAKAEDKQEQVSDEAVSHDAQAPVVKEEKHTEKAEAAEQKPHKEVKDSDNSGKEAKAKAKDEAKDDDEEPKASEETESETEQPSENADAASQPVAATAAPAPAPMTQSKDAPADQETEAAAVGDQSDTESAPAEVPVEQTQVVEDSAAPVAAETPATEQTPAEAAAAAAKDAAAKTESAESAAPAPEVAQAQAVEEVQTEAEVKAAAETQPAEQAAPVEPQSDTDILAAKFEAVAQQAKAAAVQAEAKNTAAAALQAVQDAAAPQAPSAVTASASQDKSEAQLASVMLRHLADSAKFTETQTVQSTTTVQASAEPAAVKTKAVSEDNTAKAKAELKSLPRQQAARTLEKVETVLKEVARAKDGKTISMRLDPPSLGRVKVDVSLRDGGLHARITAESPQVSQLLKDKAGDLQITLRKLGLNVDRVSVSVSAEGSGEFSAETNAQNQQQQEQRGGRQVREDSAGGEQADYAPGSGMPAASSAVEDHWVA